MKTFLVFLLVAGWWSGNFFYQHLELVAAHREFDLALAEYAKIGPGGDRSEAMAKMNAAVDKSFVILDREMNPIWFLTEEHEGPS